MLDLLPTIGPSNSIYNTYPLSMEEIGVNGGFVLYRTVLKEDYSGVILNVSCIKDRGYVLVGGVRTGFKDEEYFQLIMHISSQHEIKYYRLQYHTCCYLDIPGNS